MGILVMGAEQLVERAKTYPGGCKNLGEVNPNHMSSLRIAGGMCKSWKKFSPLQLNFVDQFINVHGGRKIKNCA